MKNLIAKLIVELIRGTNIKLKTMNFSLNNKDQEILRQSLQKELEKPSIEQSKTSGSKDSTLKLDCSLKPMT